MGQSQTVPQTPVTDAGGNLVIAGIIVVVLAVAAAVIVGRKSFRGKAKKTPAKTAQKVRPVRTGDQQSKFCPDCGTRLERPSRFCPECGAKLV